MQAHHRAVVDRLVERFGEDPRFPAMLVGGSIAKGWEREDSDVDVIMLATDEEYQRRKPERAFHYFTTDVCDYPGGYVDGKILDWQFLVEVAERGSEPARSAFVGAIVAYRGVPSWRRCYSASWYTLKRSSRNASARSTPSSRPCAGTSARRRSETTAT